MAPADQDIESRTSIDASGLNYITITDSDTGSTDTLETITGGTKGQTLILELKEEIRFEIDNIGTKDTIQWGRGTSSGASLPGYETEIFKFLYNGTAWFLVDRYTI